MTFLAEKYKLILQKVVESVTQVNRGVGLPLNGMTFYVSKCETYAYGGMGKWEHVKLQCVLALTSTYMQAYKVAYKVV